MSVSTLADCQYFVTVNNHHDQTLHTTNPTISKVVKTPDFSKSRKLDMGPEMTVVNPSPRRAIPAKSKLSSALQYSSTGTMPAAAGSTDNAPYVAFQIRPTGVVTPPIAMDDFYFTVVAAQFADATALPDNYVTVQINPQTGTALIYRP